MSLEIPQFPDRVLASSLLHGNDADFVHNAYLALQRQWPDQGGFAHYLYVLRHGRGRRADILREIAASPNGRNSGVEFVDDLPEDHSLQPGEHDLVRLLATSLALRVGRNAADIQELRQALRHLAVDELSAAVRAVIESGQTNQAMLESRLNQLQAQWQDRAAAVDVPPPAPAGPSQADWQRLLEQQTRLTRQVHELSGALAKARRDISALRQAISAAGTAPGEAPYARTPHLELPGKR